MNFNAKNKELMRLAKAAYPNYGGRKFKVENQIHALDVADYWDGGSRDYFVFVDIRDGRTMAMPSQGLNDKPVKGANEVWLPEFCACVIHSYFCGKDCGITVILPHGVQVAELTATN